MNFIGGMITGICGMMNENFHLEQKKLENEISDLKK
jgi:hypothetical protein